MYRMTMVVKDCDLLTNTWLFHFLPDLAAPENWAEMAEELGKIFDT